MKPEQKVHIALETMAGKGTELGRTFDQLAYIIDHCDYPELLGLCLDTCHLNDAGYDISDFDAILDEVDEKIGLDKVLMTLRIHKVLIKTDMRILALEQSVLIH